MIAILKFEIVRDELPEILRREIIQYESLVVSTLTGEFSADTVSFRVGWHQGMKILCLYFRDDMYEENVELVHVESGKLSTLGDRARIQFVVNIQEETVTVDDFFVDLEARTISLLGTSVGANTTKPVKITISFNPQEGILLSIKSFVGDFDPVHSAYFDGWNTDGSDSSEESDMMTDEEDDQH